MIVDMIETSEATSRFVNEDIHVSGTVVGEHACPVCEAPVPEVFRPGRGRIYCTNSCRQRAYRWRRAHGIRTFVERDGAAERLVNDRRHALRDGRDPVAALRDRRARETTVCGVFARPIRERRVTHDRFVPEHPWSCRSCSTLISAGPYGSGIPDVVRQYAAGMEIWADQARGAPRSAGIRSRRRSS